MIDTRFLVRFASYPTTLVAVVICVALAPLSPIPWLWLSVPAALGLTVVALLERKFPYKRSWLEGDADGPADVVHAIMNLAVMQVAVVGLSELRGAIDWTGLWWPSHWPFVAQVFLAGIPLDLSLYAVHRFSHRQPFLWRLHSIHHSPHRLYWLNGERRHPLHAAIMAGPGLLVLVLLGAPALVVGGWFAVLAVHLAFQHANLDYDVGPFRHVLGVAQLHRWHHRRRYADAQVNFGEFWLIWDRLFGTFLDARDPLGPLGIEGDPVPTGYSRQIAYPFLAPTDPTTDMKSHIQADGR